MSQTNTDVAPEVIIKGKQRVIVHTVEGQPETVDVKMLPVADIHTYLDTVQDISGLIQLVTGKDEAWVKTLLPDSTFELDEIARKLNDPTAARWMERQRALAMQWKAKTKEVVDASMT